MVAALRRAADDGELRRVTRPGEIDAVLDRLMSTEWVVYSKNCLGHTPIVVDYLARYTHRIAIHTRASWTSTRGRSPSATPITASTADPK